MGNTGEFAPQWSMDLSGSGSGSGSRGSFKGQSSRSIDRISIRCQIFNHHFAKTALSFNETPIFRSYKKAYRGQHQACARFIFYLFTSHSKERGLDFFPFPHNEWNFIKTISFCLSQLSFHSVLFHLWKNHCCSE